MASCQMITIIFFFTTTLHINVPVCWGQATITQRNQECGLSHSVLCRDLLEAFKQANAYNPVTMRDCYDVRLSGVTISGIYTVKPINGPPIKLYCDMDTDGGGWTVFQRRQDGSVDFYRYWIDYKIGFGNLDGEFWLGNSIIYLITNQGRRYELRVDLEDFEGNTTYALYESFSIDDEVNKYKLNLGSSSGRVGYGLSHHDGMFFSTRDRDNDISVHDCAKGLTGAWWYYDCHNSNLNGQYLPGQTSNNGVVWYDWKDSWESLKHVEMKIRPLL
ncbi:ryncolin-1-like [Glandiceps talaboti]